MGRRFSSSEPHVHQPKRYVHEPRFSHKDWVNNEECDVCAMPRSHRVHVEVCGYQDPFGGPCIREKNHADPTYHTDHRSIR